jgi:hypothetical protein
MSDRVTYALRGCYFDMRNTKTKLPLIIDGAMTNKRSLIIVTAGALFLGAVFLAATLALLASCSASVSSTIKTDGGARISIQADVPAALSAKFRKLASAGSSSQANQASSAAPFFDAAAIRKSLAARPGISLVDLTQPSPDSIRVELSARSLEELASTPDFRESGIISITRGSSWTEFRFRLERGGAKALSALFPGIDPYLMEALSPPALEDDPVSLAEYKTMLKSVLGEKAMPAMEAATLRLSITAPSAVLSSGGGSISGSTLTAPIPIVELLALEKPVEFWLRWKTPN